MHSQPRERSLMRIVKQNDSRIWVNFTRNGLRLVSRHREPPHTDGQGFGYSCHQRRLTGLRRRRTGLLPSGPKSSFQMRASFVFHLETKVLESGEGWRAHSPSCLKSSVKSSLCIWGAMSSAGVGPLCFLKTNVTAPIYQDILEHFMLPSADQLFKDADFIFHSIWHLPHCQKHQKLVK